ncbi:MAG: hypothetical protein GXO76_13825 [Calditrichaeota bacterium]|nr:hypothetical protein [Calditrichota bacterium]
MKRLIAFVLKGTLCLASVLPALGQAQTSHFLRQKTSLVQGNLQIWHFKGAPGTFTQFALPVTVIYPVRQGLSLDMTTSPAANSFAGNHLSGFSDTRFRASYLFLGDHGLLTLGLNTPTGKSTLTPEQWNLSTVTALNALNFSVPLLGAGLNVNAGVVYARKVGPVVLGGGFSYLKKGSYRPFTSADLSYDPGDEFSFNFGVDYGEESRWTSDVTFTYYATDKMNGQQVFRSGVRVLIDLRHYRSLHLWGDAPMQLLVYVKNRTKGKNAYALGSGLQSESLNSNGNQFEMGIKTVSPVGAKRQVAAQMGFLLYSNNAYHTGGAKIFRIGAGVPLQIGSQVTFNNQFLFSVGSLTVAQKSVSVTGFSLLAGLVYKF